MQGLRAIAVGLVLLYHAGVPLVSGGYVGVDVFFVISGFLISSHLLETLERDGRIGFAQFYARRARRILPASFVVAGLSAVAVVLFAPPTTVFRSLQDALATVLYVPNIWFAAQETNYLADHSASPFQHYWSLGVEEQFYLLWPLILLVLALIVRRRRALLGAMVFVLAAVSFAACVWLTQVQQPMAFFLLPTRAWELLAGALIAIALLGRPARVPGPVAAVGGWLGVFAIVAAGLFFDDTTMFPGFAAALPVLGTTAVIFFGHGSPAGGPTAALSIRPMQFVGLISYSLYLVHWPLLVITQSAVGNERPLPLWSTVLLGIGLALPLAYALFRFVEQPLRSPHFLTRRRPRITLLATGAVTVVLALALTAGMAWASAREVPTGPAAPAAPSFPAVSPQITSNVVPANLTPSLDAVADDLPSVYSDDCHHDTQSIIVQNCQYGNEDGTFEVALFGDSHSAQWLPALEHLAVSDEELSIHSYTKSSCPAPDVTVLLKNVAYESCNQWREAVMQQLLASPPDLVVISNYSAYVLAEDPSANRRTQWSVGLTRTAERLRDAGSRVIVIADTPRFASAPATCISNRPSNVGSCAGEREVVLDATQSSDERVASEAAGGEFIDLTKYICDPKLCPVIIDNLLVYRDINHLTATFVRYLTPALAKSIVAR